MTEPTEPHDLFVSYRTDQARRAVPLLAALAALGVRVWRDLTNARSGDSITAKVRAGLASSRALAVFATEDWPRSKICAAELNVAWTAAERLHAGENAKSNSDDTASNPCANRILFLKPNDVTKLDHVQFGALSDCLAFALPENPVQLAIVVQAIKAHLDSLDTRTFGDAGNDPTPDWYPREGPTSNRFVGRDSELWELHAMLTRSRFVAITGHQRRDATQLRGLGGLGKTLLASHYAHTFSASWPGGIFWLTADPAWGAEPDTEDTHRHRLNVLLDRLAESLDVAPVPGDLRATAAAVRRTIAERTAGKRYLWVIDNLPPGISHDAVTALAPPTADGALLITTRYMALNALGERLDLGILDPNAAFTLLTARRQPATPDEVTAAHALAADVGHHPLALDILAALVNVNTTHTPYAQWRARIAAPDDTAFDQRAEALKEQLPTSCARSITRVLEASLTLLESDLALDILRLSARLADAPIPADLLVSILARLRGATRDNVEIALDNLASHALIARDHTNVSISVHAIVQWVAERWKHDQAHLDALAEIARKIISHSFADIFDIRTHASLLTLVAHALRLAEPESDPAARLGGRLASFFKIRGDYAAARMLSERALAVFERILGPEHPDTLSTFGNLAGTLNAMGDLQGARLREERTLTAQERILGPEHPDTLSTLQNLALTLYAMGDLQGARLREERVLAARERILGPEHPDTLSILQNLAGTLDAMGDLQGARLRYEQALAAQERILGPEHPDTLSTLQNLAGTLHAMGDLQGARLRFERALAAQERILGPEHPNTLATLLNLAGTLKAMGDLQGARLREERTLTAQERILGLEHPDTLRTLQNLAGTLHAMGDFEGARNRVEQALAARERILGPEHPDTLRTLQNLAITLHAMGDPQGARNRVEQALAARERILGPEHPDTLSTLQNLAGTLHAMGDFEGARNRVEQALAARERILGPEHPDTLSTLQDLAITLHAMGDLQGARLRFERALAAQERILGPEHPGTLRTLQNLAGTLYAMGDLQGARLREDRALAAQERILGPEHPDTCVSRFNLILTLLQLDPPAAEEHRRVLLPLMNRPPDELSGDQRKIVEALAQTLGPAPTTGHESAEANPLVMPQFPLEATAGPPGTSRRRRRPQRRDPSEAP